MLLLYRLTYRDILPAITIYIPLCFYFIAGQSVNKNLDKLFTFHYASTLSLSDSRPIFLLKSFTFHYASTLSNSVVPIMAQKLDLHSTMLLLYRRSEQSTVRCTTFTFHYASTLSHCRLNSCPVQFIYIPLCFYFIKNFSIQ